MVNPWPAESKGQPACGVGPQRRDASFAVDHDGGQAIRFEAGESAVGAFIKFDNNATCNGCNVKNSPVGGWVYGGVVNPNSAEYGDTSEFTP